MLFNSYSFILIFFPVVFAGFFILGQQSHRLAAIWLVMSSLVFYGLWDARYIFLLLASISFNYGFGHWIRLSLQDARERIKKQAKYCLILAITINLCLLGYFKYANFFASSVNQLLGCKTPVMNIILPIGISFFTFTQIAFLVDVYRGIVREYSFVHYLLFVTYFPHLIAGPVLHHKQMVPQFTDPKTYVMNSEHVAVGLTIFIIGLAKKVLIADSLAECATPIFDAVRDGSVVMLFESWIGALAYTLQIYFDFSGYSDMAIGLSLIFNIRLPINFDSPYKATSIISFWRRWHMTLSAFLRDYLYIPLGGSHKGTARRFSNLMATMVLGGLWHGAGWTFVVWGGLHGLYLMINHAWRELKANLGWHGDGRFARLCACLLTFLSVVVAWVFFRSQSFSAAISLLSGMAGMNGLTLSQSLQAKLAPLIGHIPLKITFDGLMPIAGLHVDKLFGIMFGLSVVWFLPNVRQMLSNFKPTWEDITGVTTLAPMSKNRISRVATWELTYVSAVGIGILFCYCMFSLSNVSEFLYFQF